MSFSTFHRFGDLPAEIRLEIWALAMRPKSLHGGIHYLALNDINYPVAPEAQGHWSAFEWDRGLLMACKESRREVKWHLQGKNPHCQKPRAIWVDDNGEKREVLARPGADLLCLLPGNYSRMVDWERLPQRLPFTTPTSPAKQLAFEFDPSWNVDLPTDLNTLLEESSPRSFFARAWVQYVGLGYGDSIWLIDRQARRSPIHPQANPRRFHDLYHEYVSAYATDILCDSEEEEKQTVRFFWNHIDKLGSKTQTGTQPLHAFFQNHFLNVRCSLRILVCREFWEPEFPVMEVVEEEEEEEKKEEVVEEGNDPFAYGFP